MRRIHSARYPIEDGRRPVLIRAKQGSAAAAVLALGLAIWGTGGAPLSAQSAETATEADVAKAECTVIDANGSTVVMVCPKAAELLNAEDDDKGLIALKKAGVDACFGKAPCIAWIWDDAANAPEKAPPLSDGLTPEQVQSAVAIWVNDAGQMMTISKQKKSE